VALAGKPTIARIPVGDFALPAGSSTPARGGDRADDDDAATGAASPST